MEVELKLELAAEDAEALATSGLFSGEARTVALEASYLDTPDHSLRKRGFSLRIRREDDRHVQTLKGSAKAAAGLFARPEWEQPTTADTPVIDDSTPLPMLLGDDVHAIRPVFRNEVARRVWQHREGEALIEVALDLGKVTAAQREAPICELEFELKSGSLAAPFALARRVDELTPVRLSVRTKAERGFNLLDAVPASYKAEAIELHPHMTAAIAFQAIIGSCLRHYRLNENLLLDKHEAGALHQARVALRRLRAAFTIFKTLYADEQAEHLREDLKWLAGLLGEARDIDVTITRGEAAPLLDQLTSARADAYEKVSQALSSKRVRALMLDVVEWSSSGAWLDDPDTREARTTPAALFAMQPLDRFRKKVKKGGAHLEAIDDHTRHEVRKDAKKLRYAAEFFAGLYPNPKQQRRHAKFVKALEALQEELGLLNDMAAAPDMVKRLGLAGDERAEGLLIGGKKKHLAAAAEAHGDFVDAKRFWR